jgi:uncharacterized protein YceK
MRSSGVGLLAPVLLALAGCGTIHNLKDPPKGPMFLGAGACNPFGGVVRSGLLATMGTPMGLAQVGTGSFAVCTGDFRNGFDQVGNGMYFGTAGLLAIADTPLSLAGDILTYPIVYARTHEYAWATWWGEKSIEYKDTSEPNSNAADK